MMRKMLLFAGLLLLSATAEQNITLGDEFLRLQNWPVAITYYEKALQENPALDSAWYGKGVALCQLGKFEDGLNSLSHALEISPKNVEYLYVTGVCHEWKGKDNWKMAEAYYMKGLQLAPNQVQLHFKLASLLQHEGRFEEAIPEYQRSIALDPNQFESYNNLGNCWLALNQPEKAVKLFQEAIARTQYPGQYHFYQSLGMALLAANRPYEAKGAFLLETALNPDFADAHINLGNVYFLERNFERAIEEYQDVIEIDPKRTEGLENLGKLYLTINQPELARKYFEQYVKEKPDDGKGHYFLGLTYGKLNDQKKAWDEYNKSLKLGYHPEPVKEQIKEKK
jgi:tetratricopeptide (TPR) repeat protein